MDDPIPDPLSALYEPKFSTHQVLSSIPGLGAPAMKQYIARGHVNLVSAATRGRGKASLYPAIDVIQIAAIMEFSDSGFPLVKFRYFWNVIESRIRGLFSGFVKQTEDKSLIFYIDRSTLELYCGDAEDEAGSLDGPTVPNTLMVFRVDRFIRQMLDRMDRVAKGRPAEDPIPDPESGDFARDKLGNRTLVGLTYDESVEFIRLAEVKNPTADQLKRRDYLDFRHHKAKYLRADQPPKRPEDDFFLKWTKDDDGNDVLIGLNKDETSEYLDLTCTDLAERSVEYYSPHASVADSRAASDRQTELWRRHEGARMERVAKHITFDGPEGDDDGR